MNILIVTSDENAASALRRVLDVARHHAVTVVRRKSEALAYARQNHLDAAVIVGNIEDAQGPEVMSALQLLPRKTMRIIGVTSLIQHSAWQNAGADVIFAPDYDLLDLLKALGEPLTGR